MNKRTEITAQTKQNIIDGFWDLYCEKRIEKITVKKSQIEQVIIEENSDPAKDKYF
jgi:hypothetical protein